MSAAASKSKNLKQTRRRLSVMSDNTLIEGMDGVNLDAEKEASTEQSPAGASSGGFIINSYGGYSKKGYAPYNPKKKNQDALIMAEDPKTRSLLLCVLDGHGEDGDKVAQSIKSKLSTYLFKHKSFATDIKTAITDVVAKVESEILRDPAIETDFSGTTFTAAVIRGNTMTTANIGDSRSTVGYRNASGGITGIAISQDHKPDLPEEKARIEAKGGRVFAVEYDDGVDGPPRVWLGHMDVPGLAMSRSLGDAVAHSAGVSSEPDFIEYTFNPEGREDLILILASDGLWEFMSDQEVMEIALTTTEPRYAVDKLISEANERWMVEEQVIDDTTVCVAFLGGFNAAPTDAK